MKKYALVNTYYGLSEKHNNLKDLVKQDNRFRESIRWKANVEYRGVLIGLPKERIEDNSIAMDRKVIKYIKANCRSIDRFFKRK